MLQDFVSIWSYIFQVTKFKLSGLKQTANLQLRSFKNLYEKKNISKLFSQLT